MLNDTTRTMHYPKETVLSRLKENRERHKKDFENALDGWRQEVREELERKQVKLQEDLDKLNKGEEPSSRFHNLPKPADNTNDYDIAIEMFEMSNGDMVELDVTDFQRLMRDDWGWRKRWTEENNLYILKSMSG